MRPSNGKLRKLEKSDLNRILVWRNSDRIRVTMFTDHVITPEEHRKWFEDMDNSDKVYFIFELDCIPVGLSNFTEIDWLNNRCFWGFYIGETEVPRGTGLLMGYLSMEYAFEQFKIRKVCSHVLAGNKVSLNYHKKLGFSEEGLFKQHIKKNDRYEDVIYLALFNDDWLKNKTILLNALQKY